MKEELLQTLKKDESITRNDKGTGFVVAMPNGYDGLQLLDSVSWTTSLTQFLWKGYEGAPLGVLQHVAIRGHVCDPPEDFGQDANALGEAVRTLADSLHKYTGEFGGRTISELRFEAKHHKVKLQSKTRKLEIESLLIYTLCAFLSSVKLT